MTYNHILFGEIPDVLDEETRDMNWKPIETAPKNESSCSYGPYIIVFNSYYHSLVHARWECHGDVSGWYSTIYKKPLPMQHHITHWMPLPPRPTNNR